MEDREKGPKVCGDFFERKKQDIELGRVGLFAHYKGHGVVW